MAHLNNKQVRTRHARDEAAAPPSPGMPEWLKRLRAAGAEMARRGFRIGEYFAAVDPGCVATQRDTKDHLPQRLKNSTHAPQVVTVQARGGEAGGTYLILPLETAVEAIESRAKDAEFVPITATLRAAAGDIDLPVLKPRGSGRRRRSDHPDAVTAPSES